MKLARISLFLLLMGILILAITPAASARTRATVIIPQGGFGAAFSFAQTIGPVAITSGGTIGNAGSTSLAIGTTGIISDTSIFTSPGASAWGGSICAPGGLQSSGLTGFSLFGNPIFATTGCAP